MIENLAVSKVKQSIVSVSRLSRHGVWYCIDSISIQSSCAVGQGLNCIQIGIDFEEKPSSKVT